MVTLIKSELELGLSPKSELSIAFSISGNKLLSQGDITRDLPSSIVIFEV